MKTYPITYERINYPITFQQFKGLVDAWTEPAMGVTGNGRKCTLHVAIEQITGECWHVGHRHTWRNSCTGASPEQYAQVRNPHWAEQLTTWIDDEPEGPASIEAIRRYVARIAKEEGIEEIPIEEMALVAV